MTLGEIIKLYQAEQEGKQIMVHKHIHGHGYTDSRDYNFEVKLSDTELSDLVNQADEDGYIEFYIKGER